MEQTRSASVVDDRYNHYGKVYVEVTNKYGNITPLAFCWMTGVYLRLPSYTEGQDGFSKG